MKNYYSYVGTISVAEGGCRSIILDDIRDDDVPPVAIRVPCTELAEYLEDRSWDDAEERYISQYWIYDSCLFLQAVVIPGDVPGIPAKVIACKDPERISGEMVIFGPEDLLNDVSPRSMDENAFRAWMEYRNTFGLRPRNIGRNGQETVL